MTTDIHAFDQTVAEANHTLDGFVAAYREADAEYGETANLVLLSDAAADLGVNALAPLFAAAIRRLAKAKE